MASSSNSGPPRKPHERGPEFLYRVKYTNTLPDIPFDGKFLPCPFVSPNRFIDYKSSALEKEHKFEVLCTADLGIEIDLIDMSIYEMDEIDEKLLEDEPRNSMSAKRSQQHAKVVPWMRKTEYISSEFNRFGVSSDRQETKVGYALKKRMDTQPVFRDRDAQINIINKTFEDVKRPVKKHYSKKGVTAVAELPILPDFDLWKWNFAQVLFDLDPAPSEEVKAQLRLLDVQGIIRGMQDLDGTQFVALFTPDSETREQMHKDREEALHDDGLGYDPEYQYVFSQVREYMWNVLNKSSVGFEAECFFLTIGEDAVLYDEIDTKVKLSRRRTAKDTVAAARKRQKRKLLVKYTVMTEDLRSALEKRERELLGQEDQEQEEMEDEEEEASSADESKESAKGESQSSGKDSDEEAEARGGGRSSSSSSHDSD